MRIRASTVFGVGSRMVDQSLVRTHLEVLPRVLVLVRGPDDAVHVLSQSQRHRTNHAGAGTGDRFHDLARRGVNSLVVVGLEPDADLLSATLLLPHSYWGPRACRAGTPPLFHLSVVHRSPRSGVSPARTLSRGRNRHDRGGDRMRPARTLVVMPRARQPKRAPSRLKATRQYALDVGPHPNLWPWRTRGHLTPE